MITYGQMYWLLQLDTLKHNLVFVILLGLTLSLIGCALGYLLSDIEPKSASKNAFKFGKTSFIVTIIAFTINSFLPTTKRMAAIIVVPAIVNNEKVQDMGNTTLDIGNELLILTKQYIEENIKNISDKNYKNTDKI